MTKTCTKPVCIAQGTKYNYLAQLGAEPLIYKAISAKVSSTPLTLTITGHGMPATWGAAFTDIGYDDIDSDEWPPADSDDFHEATTVDVNTVKFNNIDLARLDGTFANGSIAYLTPVDLTSCSAALNIYDSAGALVLAIKCTLDNTAKTITAVIDAGNVLLIVGSYTFSLLFTDSGGTVTEEDRGSINIYALGSSPS